MALAEFLADLRRDPHFMANVMTWRTIAARAAVTSPFPTTLNPALVDILRARGISSLYSHQAAATEHALAGRNVVVVTPTASGKTLCYNLPVLDVLLRDSTAHALYLFPTKALAHDQLSELQRWENALQGVGTIGVATYDGDTPTAQRARVRRQSRLLLTNPDMLHMGILPYHTQWETLLGNLRYVVIDELHSYRGVFGSHVANVLRRLQRLCALYGGHPQFICTSATIANPQQLAQTLLEQPVEVVAENGAPSGEKQIILYNPPLYDPEQGLRRSALLDAQEVATRAVLAGLQTILFGRSRQSTEILLTYLRERLQRLPGNRSTDWNSPATAVTNELGTETIRGYRGGYLPNERRVIEAGLRDGSVRAVVATNALELGIDIGGLQAAILCGYPGAIASTWQQMGRAGRTMEGAVAILIATGGLLDQYIIRHPDYIFERSPEHALINPDNLLLLVDHLRCAAFELPFQAGESFGQSPYTADALALLQEQGELQQQAGRFFWRGESYPARQVGLRNAGGDTVAIQVVGNPAASGTVIADADIDFYGQAVPVPAAQTPGRVIGQIDRGSAPLLLYEGAIYIHEGQSYTVRRLDLAESLAEITPAEVDFYTDVNTETEVEVLATQATRTLGDVEIAHGELLVRSEVVGYRRIKRFTHENLGIFPLTYAPQLHETSGYWFSLQPALQVALARQGQWFDSVNDYGPNWQAQRRRVRARDGYRCTQCGRPEAPGQQHDVHHLVPFRTFGYMPGLNQHYEEANQLNNLVLVCRTCHRRLEGGVRVRSGLDGLAYALTNIAPLHLMCDPQDLGVHVVKGEVGREEDKMTGGEDDKVIRDTRQGDKEIGDTGAQVAEKGLLLPAIYIYERVAAGLGFSARLYELHETLIDAAGALIRACPCVHGCPACVGPVLEGTQVQLETKVLALALVESLQR